MKTILVCGAGGFIGTHLVESLKAQGHYVIGADVKYPEFSTSAADEFFICDLSCKASIPQLFTRKIDEIYQLAADMGGAGYIFTGDHDASIMSNSVMININILQAMVANRVKKVFYSSSACIYPLYKQDKVDSTALTESDADPASPDSEYGWEMLFSERLYFSYSRNFGIDVKIARLHNIYGPLAAWNNGKEKVIAAICRKIICSVDNTIEVWGDGKQTRSFLYIDECIKGIHKLMDSQITVPLNIGSDKTISIDELISMIASIDNKTITLKHINGPVGVLTRNCDNTLIKKLLGWIPNNDLLSGINTTYRWIQAQITNT